MAPGLGRCLSSYPTSDTFPNGLGKSSYCGEEKKKQRESDNEA